MRDPYEILGVAKGASAAEIKSAFRKRAKTLHPDANRHDPKAANRFAELNSAYEIVGDAGKRQAYDRGEIDAEGKPRFHGFEGFGGRGRGAGSARTGNFETFTWGSDGFPRGSSRGFGGVGGFEDILKEAFRGGMGGAARGRAGGFGFEQEDFGGGVNSSSGDVAAAITISLLEAAHGVKKRVQLPTGKEVEVKIPAGLGEGQQIRLKGQGAAGSGGHAGDVLITVSIAPHALFAREGADLRLELPITLYEAVLGAKVRVPTLDGAVELAIPAGTDSGVIMTSKSANTFNICLTNTFLIFCARRYCPAVIRAPASTSRLTAVGPYSSALAARNGSWYDAASQILMMLCASPITESVPGNSTSLMRAPSRSNTFSAASKAFSSSG
jgi:DnaJ-class molecular chaperone